MTRAFGSLRLAALLLAASFLLPGAAAAQEEMPVVHAIEIPDHHFSFEGLFGTFDRGALQRGFQVYQGVCATCHSLDLVSYRHLEALGYNADEIKAIAAAVTVTDGPNDEGEMFDRPGQPSDRFKAPFANEQAARFANNGAYPPDLSLIAKARAGGPDYIVALLTGYHEPPAGFELGEGMSYNAYFTGHQIAMPPPLSQDSVTYQDGTAATVEQMSADVATFLMWTAEPHLETRKQTGVKVVLFLLVMTGLLYAAKRKVWADLH
jgi:ubiquinol-cytochrome c reductase cytochrome c1 subunit